jgi:hypothetical protein
VQRLASLSCTQTSQIDDAQRELSQKRAQISSCVAHISEVVTPMVEKKTPELDVAGARALCSDFVIPSSSESMQAAITRGLEGGAETAQLSDTIVF